MRTAFTIFACMLVFLLHAQDPYGIPITKRNGLPSNEIYNIVQDSKGFIWMGTGAGICRYDGFSYKTYPLTQQRPPAGTRLREDKYGRIWYTTFDGWLHFVENDSLYALPKQKQPAGSVEYGLTDKVIYALSAQSIDIYDLNTLLLIKSVFVKNQYFINATQHNDNYCLLADSLYIVNGNGNISSYPTPRPFVNGYIVGSNKDELLILPRVFGSKKAFKFNGKEFVPAFELPESFIHAVEYCDNTYWFFTDKGIFKYSKTGVPLNNTNPLFEKELMTCLMKDRENNYWFGSKDNAILLVHDFNQYLLFKDRVPVQLEIAGTKLFCAFRSGGASIMPLPIDGTESNADLMTGKAIYMMKYDSASKIMFYTHSQGFVALKDNKPIVSRDAAIKGVLPLSETYAVYAASGSSGMIRLTNKPDPVWDNCYNKYKISRFDNYEVNNITGNLRGRDVAVSENGKQAWIATNQGLYMLNSLGGREIRHNNEDIVCRRIHSIKNLIYGLTVNGDLICINPSLQMEKLSGRFQIPSQIEQLYCFGNLLVMVRAGSLLIFDVNHYGGGITEIKTNASDIFDIEYYNTNLLLATPEGLLVLKYSKNSALRGNPPFVINSILVNNVRLSTGELLNLNSDQQQIDISYSILSYGSVSANELYYRINKQEWVKCDAGSRTLKLAGLSSGDYSLEFKFGNGTPVSKIRFQIAPPWWKHPLTYAAIGVILIVLGYFFYRYLLRIQAKKSRQITERLELERNFDRSVLTAIRSQMNPHFFFNALNTIQSYIFENDRQNAGTYLSKFSKLTRMVLEMSGRDLVTLSEETDALQLYLELEKARFTADFSFEIRFADNVDKELIRIPPMLLQPYVENAVKHGLLHKKGKKNLTLSFTREQQLLTVEITDNGIGRKRSEELNKIRSEHHESFSSEANQKRLELLNKGRTNKLGVEYIDKTDDHGMALGTTVIITIPF